jgi:LPS-assembly protein
VSTGQRIDYGLRLGFYGDAGESATVLVGQSYAFQRDSAYVAGSGVNETWSDYVGRISLSPGPLLDFVYRFRLDEDELALRRNEVGVSAGPAWLRIDSYYLQVAPRPDVPQIGQRRELATALTARLSTHWTGQLRLVRDLGAAHDKNRSAGVTFNYGDECFGFVFDLTRRYTTDGALKPDTTAFIRLVFKNLGQVEARGLGF